MLDPQLLAPERVRPLYRREYERLVELGVFEDERVELLRGQLVEMSPQGTGHASVIEKLNELLVTRLVGRARIRPQLPLAISDDSEPEPDLAIVTRGDHTSEHPSTAYLLIEVAESSLRKDRQLKRDLYAEQGVPEYWVVHVEARQIEVHRRPEDGAYRSVSTIAEGQTVAIEAFPDVVVPVAALFG